MLEYPLLIPIMLIFVIKKIVLEPCSKFTLSWLFHIHPINPHCWSRWKCPIFENEVFNLLIHFSWVGLIGWVIMLLPETWHTWWKIFFLCCLFAERLLSKSLHSFTDWAATVCQAHSLGCMCRKYRQKDSGSCGMNAQYTCGEQLGERKEDMDKTNYNVGAYMLVEQHTNY